MAYRRITVAPEQPDSLPNVSRRVLPLSVSPAERREIEEEQASRRSEAREQQGRKPGNCNQDDPATDDSTPDESNGEAPAREEQGN